MQIHLADLKDMSSIVRFNRKEYWDLELYDLVSEDAKFNLGVWWVEKNWLQWHFDILKKSNGGILLANIENEIVGELDFVISPNFVNNKPIKHVHIIWLLVDKNSRKLGVATQLIEKLRVLYPQYEIWVDPEDSRSESLYRKYSQPFSYYVNFEYTASNLISQDSINKRNLSYEYLVQELNSYSLKLQVGKYYAPLFDIMQLYHGEQVKELIWGDFEQPPIVEYSLNDSKLVCILTPSLRIFSYGEVSGENSLIIIKKLLMDLMLMGYTKFEAQLYREDDFVEIFKKLKFTQISDTDPIFNLQSQ